MPNRLIPSSLISIQQNIEKRVQALELEPLSFGNANAMQKAVADITKRVGTIDGMRPARDRLHEAISLAFAKGVGRAMETHLRYLCWGLFEPWEHPPRRLLDEAKLFHELLKSLEQTCQKGGMLPRDWRGLLEAYFRCEPSHKNHHLLRETLKDTLPLLLRKCRYKPDWLNLMESHPNLLSQDPTGQYAADVLVGKTAITDCLRDRLNIPIDSWFWRELLLSHIRLLCSKNDEEFYRGMEALLGQLRSDQYQLVRDKALTHILDRYQGSKKRSVVHPSLKEAALSWWGSPHLERNSKWGSVQPATRKMVRTWLSGLALKDFFTLLQEDRQADERRLQFWLRYQGSIDSFHFALGPRVYYSQESDYRRIREIYREHLSQLLSPGSPKNNAFILRIGDYSIVEFGMTGNACYFYNNEQLPSHMTYSGVRLYTLKNRSIAESWLSHTGSWEENFAYALKQKAIFPDAAAGTILRRQQTQNLTPVTTPEERVEALVVLARQHGATIDDDRSRGGVLWVRNIESNSFIAEKLRNAGFRYHAGGRGFLFSDAAQRPPGRTTTSEVAAGPTLNFAKMSTDNLIKILMDMARSRGFRVIDNRPQGGPLWIHQVPEGDEFGDLLREHGFQNRAGHQWWRK